jgi:predicted GIY-YIG superfamily endonuclease
MFIKKKAWSYVLQLEDNCYYCGATKNKTYRIYQHFNHDGGSKWCYLHKPKKVVYMKEFPTYREAFKDEQKNTVDYMRKHGIRYVRGADALNCRSDCYVFCNLKFWIPKEIRDEALSGLLGKVDPPLG